MGLFDKKDNEKKTDDIHLDRRHYPRIDKHFILTYFLLDKPEERIEETQLKNISMGGLCFITSRPFDKGTQIGIEMQTPYLSDMTYVEGIVLESHKKVEDMIYETRLAFKRLSPDAEFIVSKMLDFFITEEKRGHAHDENI